MRKKTGSQTKLSSANPVSETNFWQRHCSGMKESVRKGITGQGENCVRRGRMSWLASPSRG
jgi:hypothetical protein